MSSEDPSRPELPRPSHLTAVEEAAALQALRAHLFPLPRSSALSTTAPSSSQHQQTSSPTQPNEPLKHIGRGTCGVVFTQHSSDFVWKQAVEGWEENLKYENELQKRTYRVFEDTRAALDNDGKVEWELPLVPDAFEYLERPDAELLAAAKQGHLEAAYRFDDYHAIRRSNRIYPLPSRVRSALIDLFSPLGKTREWLARQKTDPGNEDAIARVYLGKPGDDKSGRKRRGNSMLDIWGLRNFHLDRSRLLSALPDTSPTTGTTHKDITPLLSLASSMSRALAISHHLLHNDANDIEFVLGCTSLTSSHTHLWLLDFDKVRPLSCMRTQMAEGVKMAVESVLMNDPYFCSPASGRDGDEEDAGLAEEVWRAQREAYVEMSEWIAGRMGGEEEARVVRVWTGEFVRALEEAARRGRV